MTDSANPRRSVRSKKKTTFFSIGNRKQVLESIKESDEKQSDDSEGNAEEESIEETRNYDADQADDDSDNMEEFDLSNQALQGQSSKRKPRGVKTTKPAKKRKIDTKMNESSIDINSLSLFESLKSLDQVTKKGSSETSAIIQNLANKWIKEFRLNRISAMVDIVNFVLLCSGASKEWIERDVDLDALEPEELDELLKDMISELTKPHINSSSTENQDFYSGPYPLAENTRKQKQSNIRISFVMFWEFLTDSLLDEIYSTMPTTDIETSVTKPRLSINKSRGSSYDILSVLIDQLISLSSMPVVNIRDAITESLGTIGKRIVVSIVKINDQLSLVNRQLNAEEKKSSSGTKNTAKFNSFSKQKDIYVRIIADLNRLSQLVFNSILVHRFKDSHERVRIVCTKVLTDWMIQDPPNYCIDEYLKYICWMTFDPSAEVRKESLISLGKLLESEISDDLMTNMRLTMERFTERFIEIASGDINDEVSLQMYILLRKFQTIGFLDHIGDELDLVDQIVFDASASPRVRQECLAFVMDHTEGFEILDGEPEVTESKLLPSKGRRSKKSMRTNVSDMYDSVATRKRHAFQLETLAEFAEYHLLKNANESDISELLSGTDLLADACAMLPNFKLLFDWPVTTTLLMKESDDVITTTLRDPLVTIVLRLFVRTVSSLKDYIRKSHESANFSMTSILQPTSSGFSLSVDESVLSKGVSHLKSSPRKGGMIHPSQFSASSKELEASWESLLEHLVSVLPSLLQRFRDNPENLRMLISVVDCCSYSSSHRQLYTTLLKTMSDLFVSTANLSLLETLTIVLRRWVESFDGGSFVGSVRKTIDGLYESSYEKFQSCATLMKNYDERENANSKIIGQRRRKSKASSENMTPSDISTSLTIAGKKLLLLWKNFDCRHCLKEQFNTDAVIDEFLECGQISNSYLETNLSSNVETIEYDEKYFSICIDCIHIVWTIILWYTKDLFSFTKQKSEESSESTELQPDEESSNISAMIVRNRDKFVEVLTNLLSYEPAISSIYNFDSGKRFIRREIFKIIGDIRTCFPARLSSYFIVDSLPFTPSQELLSQMRNVFDNEGELFVEELSKANDSFEADSISVDFIQNILRPLASALFYDPDNLNRRQASAIMMYSIINPPNDKINEFVKLFGKRFKDHDIVRYMEIQLVTLKGFYQDSIAPTLRQDLNNFIENQKDLDDMSDRKYSQRVNVDEVFDEQLSRFYLLSKKLSAGMGVGKVKDSKALSAVSNFLRACIDFAFSEDCNILFLSAASLYVKFLPQNYLRDIGNHFKNIIAEKDLEDIRSWPDRLSMVHQTLSSFYSHVVGSDDKSKKMFPKSDRPMLSDALNDTSKSRQGPGRKKVTVTGSQSQQKSHGKRTNSSIQRDTDNIEGEDEDLNIEDLSIADKPASSTLRKSSMLEDGIPKRPSRQAASNKFYYEGDIVDEDNESIPRNLVGNKKQKIGSRPKSKALANGKVALGLSLEDDDDIKISMEGSPVGQMDDELDSVGVDENFNSIRMDISEQLSPIKMRKSNSSDVKGAWKDENNRNDSISYNLDMDENLDDILAVPSSHRLR